MSSTLSGDLGWNSTVIDGDPVAHVHELQQQGEGDIAVTGGIETIRSLFLAGAIDTLTLTVHPAATDQGRRLFDESVPVTRLSLVEGTTTSAGNAYLPIACAAEQAVAGVAQAEERDQADTMVG